jgi:cyclase
VVKGVQFVNLRDARDPVEAAEAYCREGADELVFLDIMATVENRKTRLEWVKNVSFGDSDSFDCGRWYFDP